MKWTSKILVGAFYEQLNRKNYKWIGHNLFFFDGFESDLVGVTKSDLLHEIEIKISKSDILNDRKKSRTRRTKLNKKWTRIEESKDEILENGNGPNKFYYLLPRDLYEKSIEIIPEFAGVFVADHKILQYSRSKKSKITITKIREAKELHKNKCTDEDVNKIKTSMYWKSVNIVLKHAILKDEVDK